MGAHRQEKHRTRNGIAPLLVCWLVAVGIMILVSSSGKALHEPPQNALPETTSSQGSTPASHY